MEQLSLPDLSLSTNIPILPVAIALVILLSFIIISFLVRKLVIYLTNKIISPQLIDIYQQIIKPEINWLILLWFLGIADITILVTATSAWLKVGEIFISLSIVFLAVCLSFQWISRLFESYLLDKALQKGTKINSEFLIIGKYSGNIIIFIINWGIM